MNFKFIYFFLFLSLTGYSQRQLEGHEVRYVENFISDLQKNKIASISKKVRYPLVRKEPLPPIKDATEMKSRFFEVFDDGLVRMITTSNIDQWVKMPGKGISFKEGVLWMDSVDGKVYAVNYTGFIEEMLLDDILNEERGKLFFTLQDFKEPVFSFKTIQFLVRIDQMEDKTYRYAAWEVTKEESMEPETVIAQGNMEVNKAGDTQSFVFQEQPYTYSVFKNLTGQDNRAEITLVIEKDGAVVLAQDGYLTEK